MKKEDLTVRVIEKFKAFVFDTDFCILWEGVKNKKGYGEVCTTINSVNKKQRAHRLSYAIFNGEVPDDKQVLHSCDTPACINPKHLFLGTNQNNMQDCLNKGRINREASSLGRSNSKISCLAKSKLSNDDIIIIKDLYNNKLSQSAIADKFGVSQSAISKIVLNKIRF